MSKKVSIIVGSVIAVVIIVLVIPVLFVYKIAIEPRTEVINNTAKEAEIRANVLMVEGITRNQIENYLANEKDIELLENAIKDDINSVSAEDKMVNPITKKQDCIERNNILNGGAVVYISKGDNEQRSINSMEFWPDKLNGAEGMIGYAAYKDESNNRICVKIIPYDSQGNKITDLEKVISQ